MMINNLNGVMYYTSEKLNKIPSIKHFFSTKIGGISKGFYSELNLGVYTNDEKRNIDHNFKSIFKETGLKDEKVVYLKQIHSNKFHVVNSRNYVKYIGKDGDALITSDKGLAIGVFTADCVPILLVDSKKNIISAVHAGWKGTNTNIIKNVIDFMIKHMGSQAQDIYAAIGPSIGPCCFEVGMEVADFFNCSFKIQDKYYVDLWKENYQQILICGIPQNNIDVFSICTYCNPTIFYSYRKNNGFTGRMGSFIQII